VQRPCCDGPSCYKTIVSNRRGHTAEVTAERLWHFIEFWSQLNPLKLKFKQPATKDIPKLGLSPICKYLRGLPGTAKVNSHLMVHSGPSQVQQCSFRQLLCRFSNKGQTNVSHLDTDLPCICKELQHYIFSRASNKDQGQLPKKVS
jgi:hypothetical protein